MDFVSVNSDGMVILAGVYQLFPLKSLWFWVLAILGSILSYALSKGEKSFKGIVFFVLKALFVVFVIGGAVSDIFGKDIPDWCYTLIGFFANAILNRLIEDSELIIDKLYNMLLKKLGIEIKDDDTKRDN